MNVVKQLHAVLNRMVESDIKQKRTRGFQYLESRPVICGSEHLFRLPLGKCAGDVVSHSDAIAAAVGAPVEIIDRVGGVIIRVVEKDFPEKIKFNPEHLQKDKLLIGYDRLMKPIYHRLMHLLVGGASRAGKTVWLRWFLYQLVRMNAMVKIADLKGFSFFPFETMPNVTIAKTLEETADLLFDAMTELERRENLIIQSRNRALTKDLQPYVVVIDEAAQISPKMYKSTKARGEKKSTPHDYAVFCDEAISRIAQKGGETKVILIYCTQKPTNDIVNGQVKANVETALSFRTNSHYESAVILGAQGAERISIATPGRCIYRAERFHTLQVPFISEDDSEWEKLLQQLKTEVLHGGASKRTESPRHYIDGAVQSASSHSETNRTPQPKSGPVQKGVFHPAGSRNRQPSAMGMVPPRKAMEAQQEGPQADEVYSSEFE